MGKGRNSREIRPNMAENSGEGGYIQLTANIVSAYVSNNTVMKSLDVKNEDVRIILQEMAKDDYAVAGTLVMDKKA